MIGVVHNQKESQLSICLLFLEAEGILVYQIKTQNYVNALDVHENGEWQTFEAEKEDTFESFNHETGNLLEGQGFVLNQNDVNHIVEIINGYIQNHKSYSPSSIEEDEVMPVHIVSSESAAGSLRVGLDWPKVVIGFPDSFSIGPL